jgi:hypothetical protein
MKTINLTEGNRNDLQTEITTDNDSTGNVGNDNTSGKVDDLILHVKKCYFDQIKNGTKHFEYRLRTDYWKKRLSGRDREYSGVQIHCGYPKKTDESRIIRRPWRGYYWLANFTHEHFGDKPVSVYAIRLGQA